MPVARVHQYSASGARRQRVRKVPPQRDRAQSLVQHDDGWQQRRRAVRATASRVACHQQPTSPNLLSHDWCHNALTIPPPHRPRCSPMTLTTTPPISAQGTIHCAATSSGSVPELASCFSDLAHAPRSQFGQQRVEANSALAERVAISEVAERESRRRSPPRGRAGRAPGWRRTPARCRARRLVRKSRCRSGTCRRPRKRSASRSSIMRMVAAWPAASSAVCTSCATISAVPVMVPTRMVRFSATPCSGVRNRQLLCPSKLTPDIRRIIRAGRKYNACTAARSGGIVQGVALLMSDDGASSSRDELATMTPQPTPAS